MIQPRLGGKWLDIVQDKYTYSVLWAADQAWVTSSLLTALRPGNTSLSILHMGTHTGEQPDQGRGATWENGMWHCEDTHKAFSAVPSYEMWFVESQLVTHCAACRSEGNRASSKACQAANATSGVHQWSISPHSLLETGYGHTGNSTFSCSHT